MCPLYGGSRDISLFRHINRELINNIVDTRIDIFKHSLLDTKENLYGEALRKAYFPSVRVACLINVEDQAWDVELSAPDVHQKSKFAFLRDDLKDIANLVLEVGDILHWNEDYFEINSIIENQYFMRRNDETNKVDLKDNWSTQGSTEWGWSPSIIVDTHKTMKAKLSLERIRGGIPKNI